MLLDELKNTQNDVVAEINNATSIKEINEIRVKVFGKNGILTSLSRGMRDVSPEDRPIPTVSGGHPPLPLQIHYPATAWKYFPSSKVL